MSKMNPNIEKEMKNLLEKFSSPDSLSFVAKGLFKRGIGIPSDNWSLLNRLIMLAHGTLDARGPKSWFREGRKVTKANHFCITAPRIILTEEEVSDGKGGTKEEKVKKCIGFFPICVWPYEKTIGEKEIDYKPDQPLPNFIGIELLTKWGIAVKQGFSNPSYIALYDKSKQELSIATPDQQIFFRQLVRITVDKLNEKKTERDANEEAIISEFGSAVLMSMCGLSFGTKNVCDYIVSYSDNKDKDVIDCIIPIFGRISKVVNFILSEMEEIRK